jgi:hypothetical protein
MASVSPSCTLTALLLATEERDERDERDERALDRPHRMLMAADA